MRVLILSQYYDPEPVPKAGELARELARRGHGVAAVTGLPNYPSGSLYPGFRLTGLRRELRDGIPVFRAFELPYHGRRVLGRILNYVSFMVSAPIAALFAPPCDVIYVWHPPLTVGVAAWLIARWRRVPFVYDVQDIWPDSVVLSGLLQGGLLVRLVSALERFVYGKADHLLVVTDGARENLIAKGVPANKVTVMPHWVDEELFQRSEEGVRERVRREYAWGDRFVVLFAGNLGLVQGLDTVVQAMSQVGQTGILLVFIGEGADKSRLHSMVESRQLNGRVQFIERQPMANMPAFLAAADALLVHLRRSELSRYVIPTKTLAYLAAGRPILMAMEGAAADLVTAAGAGVAVTPEDPAALADAMTKMAAMTGPARDAMGQRGKVYVLSHLTKQKVITDYESILQRVVSGD